MQVSNIPTNEPSMNDSIIAIVCLSYTRYILLACIVTLCAVEQTTRYVVLVDVSAVGSQTVTLLTEFEADIYVNTVAISVPFAGGVKSTATFANPPAVAIVPVPLPFTVVTVLRSLIVDVAIFLWR